MDIIAQWLTIQSAQTSPSESDDISLLCGVREWSVFAMITYSECLRGQKVRVGILELEGFFRKTFWYFLFHSTRYKT